MAKKSQGASGAHKVTASIENSRWFVPVAFLVLAVATVFLFSDFIFSDQMMDGGDILQASLMFRIYKVTSMASHGTIPQWMPHQFGGMPYVEAFHSDIFYPPTLAFNYARIWFDDNIEAIDIARDLGWLLILHIYFAGLFMYRAARQFKLGRIAALMAGACYMFAGYFVSMVAPGHDGKIYVIALFPLMMFFLARGFDCKPLKYFSLTGLSIGLILLTPHPQMSYFALWALSFYAAFRLILIWVEKKSFLAAVRPGLLVVYAVLIGVLFSAIQMYPGVLYTGEYSPRADTKKGWDWATSWSMHQEEAASLVIPEFCGTAKTQEKTYYWGKNAFKDNSEWLGTIALFMATLGFFFSRRRKHAWFFGGLFLFALLYALGGTTPFFWIVYTLVPKVSSMRSASMIMFLGSFSLAMLAGMGLQAVIEWREKSETVSKKFDYLLFGFPGFLLLLALGFSVAGRVMLSAWTSLFYSDASTRMVQQGVSTLDVAYANLGAIQTGAWFAFLFTGLTALFIWLYRERKVGAGILVALVALPVVDGLRFNGRFVRVVDKNEFNYRFGENNLTRFLAGQAEPMRVLSLAAPKDANMPVHGIDVLVGYHGNQLRWFDDLLGGPALFMVPEANLLQRGLRANPRLCNLAGVRFMIDQTNGMYPPDHFGPIPTAGADIGNAVLLRNDNAFPRVFLADIYRLVEGDSIVAVRDGDTTRMRNVVNQTLFGPDDLRTTVLLEEPPLGTYVTAPADSMVPANADSAWIIDYQPDSVLVGVNVSSPKFLILTDTWFPSWHATIDGQPAPTLRAYGAFRAVELPAGASRVLFRFESERYATGRMVTWITAVYLLGIIAFSIVYGGRKKDEIEKDEEDVEIESVEEENE